MAEVKWIKITTDIFSDEKILLIEQMPEADTMLVIWFKLLCMAGRDNNNGIFLLNNRLPYTEEMLATLFRRPLNTVRLAISTFEAFGMIEIEDDIIMLTNWEKHQNLDGLEKIREDNRRRQRECRERKRQLLEDSCHVMSRDGHAIEEEIDKEKEIEEEKKEKKKKKKESTIYYPADEALNQAFADYAEMRKQIKKPMTEKAISLAMGRLKTLAGNDNDMAIQILDQSTMNCWQSLYPLKEEKKQSKTSSFEDMWRNA